jgi:hypothetical protein
MQYILVKGERLKVKGEENGSLAPFPLPLYPLTEKYWVVMGVELV